MLEFNGKRLLRVVIDAGLIICGIVWGYSLLTFAGGTMDTSMEAEAVTRYQLKALAALIISNVIIVILFKFRKKIKEKMDEEAEK